MSNNVVRERGNFCYYYRLVYTHQYHREDGPAIEHDNGDTEWYFNGQLHRTDGPAIERFNGTKEYWINNQLHRLDGPAIEYATGEKQWYLNGQRHRTDGPAVECTDGTKEWWFKGFQFSKHKFSHKEFYIKLMSNSKFSSRSDYPGRVILFIKKNKKFHNEDGPAIIDFTGSDSYYINGKFLTRKQYLKMKKKTIPHDANDGNSHTTKHI